MACAPSKDSDKPGDLPSLIKATCHFVGFVMRWLNYLLQIEILKSKLAAATKMLERSQKEAVFHIKNLEGFIKK